MQIDEAGRHGVARGVYFLSAVARHFANGGDLAVVDGDITIERFVAGAVDNGAAADY